MNKKQIIQLIIVIFCFGAAGLVLYNGFFKGGGQSISAGVTTVQNTQDQQQQVLPYGNTLDFTILESRNQQYNLSAPIPPPSSTGIGVAPQNLIAVPSASH